MTIDHIDNGAPMTGDGDDEFVIAHPGSTGINGSTANAGDSDDWVMRGSQGPQSDPAQMKEHARW